MDNVISKKQQDEVWKNLPNEFKKKVKRVYNNPYYGNTALITQNVLEWLFNMDNLMEGEAKKEEEREHELYKKLKLNMAANNIKIPFDITLAKEIANGTKEGKIVTRSGLPVRIICFDRKDPVYPIVALLPCKKDGVDVEVSYSFTTGGETIVCDINESDLMLEIPGAIGCNGKQVHCKFCEGEKKKVWKQIGFTRKGGEKYGYVEIVEHPSFGETCDLRICGDKLCIDYNAYSTDSSFNDEIKINFCPMCGRKLPNKNE